MCSWYWNCKISNTVLPDGSLVVKINKLSYGFVEVTNTGMKILWRQSHPMIIQKGARSNVYSSNIKTQKLLSAEPQQMIASLFVSTMMIGLKSRLMWWEKKIKILQLNREMIWICGDAHISMDHKRKQVIITQLKHVNEGSTKSGTVNTYGRWDWIIYVERWTGLNVHICNAHVSVAMIESQNCASNHQTLH